MHSPEHAGHPAHFDHAHFAGHSSAFGAHQVAHAAGATGTAGAVATGVVVLALPAKEGKHLSVTATATGQRGE